MSIHVFAPEVTMRRVVRFHCPDCGRNSRLIGFHQEWFGWKDTCLNCGRGWDGGEWLDLPFVRGSRRKQMDAAKARWRATEGKVIRIDAIAEQNGTKRRRRNGNALN